MFNGKQIYYDVRGREHSKQEIDYKCVNILGWRSWQGKITCETSRIDGRISKWFFKKYTLYTSLPPDDGPLAGPKHVKV
jgi:hypothetical protein